MFGQLVGARHGVNRCGITIVLWRRFPGQGGFSAIARTSTLAGGRYSFVFPAGSVSTNRDWYATARGLSSRGARRVRPSRPHADQHGHVRGRRRRRDVHRAARARLPGRAGMAPAARWPALGDDVRLARARRRGVFAQPQVHHGPHRAMAGGSARVHPQSRILLGRREDQDRPGDWDPQDPPRGHHHAGEPLLRQLLRDLPRRRRDPARRVRPGSGQRRVRGPLPRLLGPQLRRPARREQRARRHRQRPDGRVRRPGRAGHGLHVRGTPTAVRAPRTRVRRASSRCVST